MGEQNGPTSSTQTIPATLFGCSKDLPVIRELARVAIEREFGSSPSETSIANTFTNWTGSALFGDALVGASRRGRGAAGRRADSKPCSRSASESRPYRAVRVDECRRLGVRGLCVVRLKSTCRRIEVVSGSLLWPKRVLWPNHYRRSISRRRDARRGQDDASMKGRFIGGVLG